jgi:hypothetical protein
MIKRSTLTLTAAVLALAACGEMKSPLADGPSLARSTKSNPKNSTATVVDSTVAVSDSDLEFGQVSDAELSAPLSDGLVPENTIRQAADAPALMTYSASFTAIQGEGNTFVVFYENPWTDDGTQGDWFMKLDIPADAQLLRADGTAAVYGDAIEITVQIDPSLFFAQFGPHGSQFDGRRPAQLSFNLEFAEPLSRQAQDDLQAWYQPEVGEQWTPRATTVDLKRNKVILDLYHFSNYAIAF